ncbi:MAG: VIT1/CCC1 transporter family protein [Bifidobacteriaceae bacterium]|nr:VIT1/CCC1 transporter family protein [Bifidobacteriaceae bacterium]
MTGETVNGSEPHQAPGTPAPVPVPGATLEQVRRWRANLADEEDEAVVYRQLARRRDGEERAILEGLAEAEARHAAYWEHLLDEHDAEWGGDALADSRRGWFRRHVTRFLAFLARHFGFIFALAMAARAEARGSYAEDPDAPPSMVADETIHGEVVRGLAARGRARISGMFRAAIFGAGDGLISNLSLVLGVGAAGVSAKYVLVTGVAGLLSGALSMGAGEYISVRSQRELLHASDPDPRAHTAVEALDLDQNELALVYRARGMEDGPAQERAAAVLAGKATFTDPEDETTAAAEHQTEAIGTGARAAAASFCFFACGALIPVLPYLFGMTGLPAVFLAVGLVGIALLTVGACVGMLSGASPVKRALRQLAVGFGAAAITYALGTIFDQLTA